MELHFMKREGLVLYELFYSHLDRTSVKTENIGNDWSPARGSSRRVRWVFNGFSSIIFHQNLKLLEIKSVKGFATPCLLFFDLF